MNMPFLLLGFFDDIRVARVCIRVRGPIWFLLSLLAFVFAFVAFAAFAFSALALFGATWRPSSLRSLVTTPFAFKLALLSFAFALWGTTRLILLTLPALIGSVSLLPAVVTKPAGLGPKTQGLHTVEAAPRSR